MATRVVLKWEWLLIQHAGTHKTGTSDLQKLLLLHRQVLAEESIGLAVPVDDPVGNHHQLVGFLDQGDAGFQHSLRLPEG